MGYGSYNAKDWGKLKDSKGIGNAGSVKEIFVRREIDPRFDPKYIAVREARDSEDHPNSTPIILGLDVTGSMGYLSEQIAKEALNETMLKLYSTNIIEDPAILFAAYGDYRDYAPLQVTQFESDIRIAEQLLDLWLEDAGSGQVVPYLLWYFAGKHTKLDAYDNHDKKGFLITIGDDAECRFDNTADTIQRVFGEIGPGVEACLAAAKEKFEVMHIFIGEPEKSAKKFMKLLPGRTMTIGKNDITYLPQILISAMQIAGGTSVDDSVEQWDVLARPIVRKAVGSLTVGGKKKGIFF